MQSIDTSRSETISFCGTRGAPDERSGDRSGCPVSSQKQTTVKIRCIVDSPNVEADSESRQRPRDPHAGATSALMLHLSVACPPIRVNKTADAMCATLFAEKPAVNRQDKTPDSAKLLGLTQSPWRRIPGCAAHGQTGPAANHEIIYRRGRRVGGSMNGTLPKLFTLILRTIEVAGAHG